MTCEFRRKPWEDWEKSILLSNTKFSYADIAWELDRTEPAINRQMVELGIKTGTKKNWEDWELSMLVGNSYAFDDISWELDRSNKSVNGARRSLRAQGIELYKLRNDGWSVSESWQLYWLSKVATIREAAAVIGRSYDSVKRHQIFLRDKYGCVTKFRKIQSSRGIVDIWTKKDELKILSLSEYMGPKEMAAIIGRTHFAVKERLSKLGVVLKDRFVTYSSLSRDMGVSIDVVRNASIRLGHDVIKIGNIVSLTELQEKQIRFVIEGRLKNPWFRNKCKLNPNVRDSVTGAHMGVG